jgi:hypothetical protein
MTSRPKPITDAVKYVGSGISAALAVVQTLVVLGVLSNAQATQVTEFGYAVNDATPILADAATTFAAIVGGLITLGTGVAASFGVAKTAEAKVTPVSSPMDEYGQPLAPVAGPVA